MKQDAQAAHVRKDPKLPSDATADITAQSVFYTVRFAVRSQRKVLLQVTPLPSYPALPYIYGSSYEQLCVTHSL